MTPEERERAGRVITDRITELGSTVTHIAHKAGLDPRTLRAVISGQRWPRDETRARINAALDWPEGEVTRRALGSGIDLTTVSMRDLVGELWRRVQD